MPKSRIGDRIEFMRIARDRFNAAKTADKEDRDAAISDTDFAAGNQWLDADRDARQSANRPILTWNRCGGFIAQVVNDGRENKPAIKVSPMDGGTKPTAEFYQSRIRQIEYDSEADIAYDTSREHQVTSGRGFYRVTTRYVPGSMDQEARLERIENQFSVFFGAAREYDRSDAEYCFVLTRISRDEYKRRFGSKTETARCNFFTDSENPAPEWIGVGVNNEEVQIAEYWLKEHKKRKLIQLASGDAMYEDELPEHTPADAYALDEAGEIISRMDDVVTVRQYIIDGVDILDETEWLGSLIPIIPLWGKELTVKGKRCTYSLIRPAKDPQRLINLYVSNIAEQIAQMPKTPYVAAEGQIPPQYMDDWATINTNPKAFLLYKPLAIGGIAVPPPSRNVFEPPIQALTIGLTQAIDAMKAACNIYDSSLGARSNETSGIAIQRRKKESDVANFHFHDNEARSRRLAGRILLELIPLLDKGARTVATRSQDNKTKMVRVNEPWTDPETNEMVHHRLGRGKYNVAISTGPSYDSQREQAFDVYSQIANADKQFMVVAGDLLFRNMDAPGADMIADRYEKLLPPQLQADKGGSDKDIPPQLRAYLQQLTQQHSQLTDTVHQLQNEKEQKTVEMQSRERIAEMQEESRIRIAQMQEETKRTLGIAQLNSGEGLKLLESELSALKQRIDLSHKAALQDAAQRHEANLQYAGRQHTAALEGAAQQHDQAMQTADQQHQAAMAEQARQNAQQGGEDEQAA